MEMYLQNLYILKEFNTQKDSQQYIYRLISFIKMKNFEYCIRSFNLFSPDII